MLFEGTVETTHFHVTEKPYNPRIVSRYYIWMFTEIQEHAAH